MNSQKKYLTINIKIVDRKIKNSYACICINTKMCYLCTNSTGIAVFCYAVMKIHALVQMCLTVTNQSSISKESATGTLLRIYSYEMPYLQIMGYNSIITEIVCGLCGTIGVILTVPIQAFITTAALKMKK